MSETRVVLVCPKCGSINVKLLKSIDYYKQFLFECSDCKIEFGECHMVEETYEHIETKRNACVKDLARDWDSRGGICPR